MTATRSLTLPSCDVVDIAFLAGGLPRAVDTLLVSLLESDRVRIVDGIVESVRLSRTAPLEAAVLDALGASGRRPVDTVRWRLTTDFRIGMIRWRLESEGLLSERTWLGRRPSPDRPTRTSAGRNALRRVREEGTATSGAMQVALHGRRGLQDGRLRSALQAPAVPSVEGPSARRRRLTHSRVDAHLYADGAAVGYVGGSGLGGWGGGFDGGGGGDGGGC